MAKRFFASLLALVFLLVCLPVSADGGETARDLIAGIERYEGATTRQIWLDKELSASVGGGAEWYAAALIKNDPTLDFTRFEAALRKKLAEGKVTSPVTRMNCALVLACLGSSPDLVQKTLDSSIGQAGIMSWVYGLHLINAGYTAAEYAADDVVGILLEQRKADGGWAVVGDSSDVDVTAMTLQALAPNRALPGVAEAIDGALALLIERQLPSGGFRSSGAENANSSAMVILALACLGTSADEAGFPGGSAHMFDGLMQFALSSGGFCWKIGEDVNEIATFQVYLALSAYLAAEEGKGSVFLPDVAPGSFVPLPQSGRFPFVILCVSIPTLIGVITLFFILKRKKSVRNNPPI